MTDQAEQRPAIVLTGAAGLIGRTVMKALAGDGWHVIALDRVVPADLPDQASYIECDLADVGGYEELTQKIISHTSELKAVIHNAAYNPRMEDGAAAFGSFEEMTVADWDDQMRLNVTAPVFLTQSLLPHFSQRDGRPCKIVNVTSMYGITPPNQRLYQSYAKESDRLIVKPMGYSVTKAALDMVTRYLAVYLAERNFNVNAIAPGGLENGQPASFLKAYGEHVPMGRMGKADELVGAFRLLCGEGSDYMNGHTLVVDGGWTVW